MFSKVVESGTPVWFSTSEDLSSPLRTQVSKLMQLLSSFLTTNSPPCCSHLDIASWDAFLMQKFLSVQISIGHPFWSKTFPGTRFRDEHVSFTCSTTD